MKIEEILNDKVLCALSLCLLLLWVAARKKFLALPRLEGEAAATTLLRIVCGFLLAGASLDKIGDAAGFLDQIKECYFFIPSSLQPLTAVIIPWLEFFTGLCLIFGFRWRAATLIFCSLMALYSLAVFSDVLQGIDCNCGCFNKNSTEKMSWWTVSRDLLFLGMGWVVLTSSATFLTPDRLNAQKKSL